MMAELERRFKSQSAAERELSSNIHVLSNADVGEEWFGSVRSSATFFRKMIFTNRDQSLCLCRFCPKDQLPKSYHRNQLQVKRHFFSAHIIEEAPSAQPLYLSRMKNELDVLALWSSCSNVKPSALETTLFERFLSSFYHEIGKSMGSELLAPIIHAPSANTIRAACMRVYSIIVTRMSTKIILLHQHR